MNAKQLATIEMEAPANPERHPLLTPENARLARHVLIAVATEGRTITYTQFADAMESLGADVPERKVGGQFWGTEIGNLLGLVAEANVSRQEPLLPSLVRAKATGDVGPGYAIPVLEFVDPEARVAHARAEAKVCQEFHWVVQRSA